MKYKKQLYKFLIMITENYENSLFIFYLIAFILMVILFFKINIIAAIITYAIMFPFILMSYNTKKYKEDRKKFIKKMKEKLSNLENK